MPKKPKHTPPPFDRKAPLVIKILSFSRPKPKQNPRVGAKVFTEPDVVRAEQELRDKVKERMKFHGITQPYLGAVKLEALFLLPYASQAEAQWAAEGGEIGAFFPPDTGNLLKLVEDACKGINGLYLDDDQVVTHTLHKMPNPWHGFLLKFTLTDPVHSGQFAKRLQKYANMLALKEEKRVATRKAAKERYRVKRLEEVGEA